MDTNPIAIVSPDYCLPNPIDLAIVRKVFNTKEDFVVVDGNDNLKFKVTAKFWSLHNKKVIVDANGNPVISLRQKMWSAHSKWEAFIGEDLIFSAKTSSMFYSKTELNVYLANNNNTTSEDVCDYKVKGSWSERSCVIYAGESTNVVAQMHKKASLLGKDKFMVTVNPSTDYAFVVALIVILDAINTQAATAASATAAGAAASAASAAAAATG